MSDDNLGTPRKKTEGESEYLSHQSLKNESDEASSVHVTMKVHGYLVGWMRYHCYRVLQEIVQNYFSNPAEIMLHTMYIGDGYSNELPKFIISKLQMFVAWVPDKYIANGGGLSDWDVYSLKREDFNLYHIQDDHSSLRPVTPLTTTSTPGTGLIMSDSQKELLNFKKRTKRDASIYPIFKN